MVAVLIPRIAAFGGLWLGALMAGALGTHFVNAEYVEWIPAGVLLGLPLTLAFLRRDSIPASVNRRAILTYPWSGPLGSDGFMWPI